VSTPEAALSIAVARDFLEKYFSRDGVFTIVYVPFAGSSRDMFVISASASVLRSGK
jgi:hypothetical protein